MNCKYISFMFINEILINYFYWINFPRPGCSGEESLIDYKFYIVLTNPVPRIRDGECARRIH